MISRKVDLAKYVPRYYNGILEIDTIIDTENKEFEEMGIMFRKAICNQFIALADEDGIYAYEVVFGIESNPATETLEGRRQRLLNRASVVPYYTTMFLRSRLDEMIGAGNYTLTIDYDTYTMTLESSAENQFWYNEVHIFVENIKPCNIVFVNKSVLWHTFDFTHEVYKSALTYNYVLNGTWILGEKPFISFDDFSMIKGVGDKSMSILMGSKLRQFTLDEVKKARINYEIEITDFETKTNGAHEAILEYIIPAQEEEMAIMRIQLLDENDQILFDTPCYALHQNDEIMKHVFKISENGVIV
nr:MAG TPA: tail protein [Caudoviricetes sp.]